MVAFKGLGRCDDLATFVFGIAEACVATRDFGASFGGDDFLSLGDVHLANEVSQVLITAVCDNRWTCECGGEVFGGLEDGPVFVYDLLDGGGGVC